MQTPIATNIAKSRAHIGCKAAVQDAIRMRTLYCKQRPMIGMQWKSKMSTASKHCKPSRTHPTENKKKLPGSAWGLEDFLQLH